LFQIQHIIMHLFASNNEVKEESPPNPPLYQTFSPPTLQWDWLWCKIWLFSIYRKVSQKSLL